VAVLAKKYYPLWILQGRFQQNIGLFHRVINILWKREYPKTLIRVTQRCDGGRDFSPPDEVEGRNLTDMTFLEK
jgi:hypothetical protein